MARRKLTILIRKWVEANIADSRKGGGDPDDYPSVADELRKSGEKLDAHLDVILKHALRDAERQIADWPGPDAPKDLAKLAAELRQYV